MKRHATRGATEFTGGQGSNLRLFVIICVFVVAGVLIAWMLAPEKPDAPVASNITYEPAPVPIREDPRPPTSWPEPRNPAETPDSAEDEKPFEIRGQVISREDGSPIPNARVNAQRVLTQEDLEAAQELHAADDKKAYIEALDASKETGYATTDEKGEFTIALSKSGSFNVSAIHRAYLDKHENGVEVVEDEDAPYVTFELVTGATVTGKIYETDSRRGVAGITVNAQGSGTRKNIESREDGTYALGGLKPGNYEISLTLRGTPYQVRGRVPIQTVSIQDPEEVLANIDFGVAAAGTVWGYIKDYEGEPIENMQAILVSSESIFAQVVDAAVKKAPPISDSSDEEGYYALYGVPLDREWRVHGMSDTLTPQLSEPFFLTESDRSVRVDLFIVDGSSVSGKVVDSESGAAIGEAQVVCVPQYSKLFAPVDKPQAVREDTSEENGTFLMPNLPEGDYQVMAYAEGYKVVTQGTRIKTDGIKDVTGVVVRLRPVGAGDYSVFGTVRDSNGRPIVDARLELTSVSTFATSAANMDTTSDSRGRFEFTGVDTGMLILNASAEGFASRVVQEVRFEEEVNVVLESLASITGRVTVRETGQPPAGGTVTATAMVAAESTGFLAFAAAAERRSSGIQPDGSYGMNLPEGRYTFEARSTGYTPSTVTIDVVEGEAQTGVDIQISQRGGSISGRVRTADSTSPSGAVVQINAAAAQAANIFGITGDAQSSNVVVGAEGDFAFEHLSPGPYTVTASLEGFAPRTSQIVSIEEFDDVEGIDLVLTLGGTVQGYVLQDGEILVGAVVTAVGNGVNQSTTSDANGQYIMDRLPPGEYLLSSVSLEDPNIRSLFAPRHATVVIEEGAVTTYNFGDEIGTRIEGYVTPAPPDGQLGFALLVLPGAADQVLALNMTNPFGWFTGNIGGAGSLVMGMGTVAADGSFVIENAPPGTHELLIIYANMGAILSNMTEVAAQQVIDVQPGDPMQLQIQVAQ